MAGRWFWDLSTRYDCPIAKSHLIYLIFIILQAFNSIVGPNGSGKSNVIDSMLFVFGYRASKIRSAKISNIIHYSDTMPNCTYAKVQVNFAMLNDKVRCC